MPLSDLLKSPVQSSYPMEISFVESANSSLNFYINFSSQALGLFHWSLSFYIIFLMFFVMVINVLNELKVIANLCRMIGDAEDRPTSKPYDNVQNKGTLSKEVLSVILEELDVQYQISEKSDRNCDETSKLLRAILKYHSSVLS